MRLAQPAAAAAVEGVYAAALYCGAWMDGWMSGKGKGIGEQVWSKSVVKRLTAPSRAA
jgi:allantoicase